MGKNLIQRIRQGQQGGTLVMVLVFMVSLFGFAALSIDVGNVFEQQRVAQCGTDAAALAAVVLLTNSAPVKSSVITEAVNIANANGLTAAEIAAGSNGVVQVGNWNTTTHVFTPDTLPWNAVRVPARRTVPLWFGKLLGLTQMTPGVTSVAAISQLGSVQNGGNGLLIPYGIVLSQIVSNKVGDTITVDTSGSGNWGKISLCQKEHSSGTFDYDMVNGVDCTVSVGDTPDSASGFAGVSSAFTDRIAANPIVLIPIVDGFGNGTKPVTIDGFVLAQLVAQSGGGNGWSGQIKILGNVVGTTAGGGGIGGTGGQPFAWARALVQ